MGIRSLPSSCTQPIAEYDIIYEYFGTLYLWYVFSKLKIITTVYLKIYEELRLDAA